MEAFASGLIDWYSRNKRILPWRDQNNAYYTWVSEIMLQQTRVEAVKPYFLRFVGELPDVYALARCEPDRLLKLWEGLGYYSRVRNMQEAARTVTEKYGGVLPDSFEELLALKGIGRYTAAAIASIAYGKKVVCVDGNVLRVTARLTENRADISKDAVKREIENELKEIIPADNPGDFNQAMMELGALVCVPNSLPRCEECPLRNLCLAFRHQTMMEYPYKPPKKDRKIEDRTILVIFDDKGTAVHKRLPGSVLAGLYEPVNLPGKLTMEEALAWISKAGMQAVKAQKLPASRHVFSHLEWRMSAYHIQVLSLDARTQGPELIRMKDLGTSGLRTPE